MKFPDETVDYMKCPICNSYMRETNNSICKVYTCSGKTRYIVNSEGYSHYEFIRYKNGEVLFHYFIPPIMIWSTQDETEIYLLEKYQNSAINYYSRQISKTTNPLFLVDDNVEDIKKKIKIYSIFI